MAPILTLTRFLSNFVRWVAGQQPPLVSSHARRAPTSPPEGGIDRILRIVVGLVLIALASTGTSDGGAGSGSFPSPPDCFDSVRFTTCSA